MDELLGKSCLTGSKMQSPAPPRRPYAVTAQFNAPDFVDVLTPAGVRSRVRA